MSDPNLHIVSLSFDDGLEKSNLKIAEIYESFGFSACFNVIALGHDLGFESPDPYHEGYPKGNFGLWSKITIYINFIDTVRAYNKNVFS